MILVNFVGQLKIQVEVWSFVGLEPTTRIIEHLNLKRASTMLNKTTPPIILLVCLTPALVFASLPSMTGKKVTPPKLNAQVQDGKTTLNASTSKWTPLANMPYICQTAAKATKLPVKAYHARIDSAPVMNLTLCVPQYKATAKTTKLTKAVWLIASYLPGKNRKTAQMAALTTGYSGWQKNNAQLHFNAKGQVSQVSFQSVTIPMSFSPGVASFRGSTKSIDAKLHGVARLF